ncbi:SUMO-activating enzyme subunit 1B-1-like [Camellia sinensis]|uniref:SUMO-activating enzyme subunit 1B-1-like n=1 Tax=Camellia sinensis TaxID=4442 RepID=UPI0010360D83|nr:SUMO-activating enzyme subunit 1B-1-like [Camellia sinensis]
MVARRRTNTVGGLETPPPAAVPETEQLIVDEVVELILSFLILFFYLQKKLDETIECQLQYPSFEDAIAVPWKSLPRRMSKLYFAMRVIEQFEEAEGRDPGQTSKDDLPKVLKLRKELFEAQSLNESLIPDSLLERLVSCTTEFPPVCAVIGGILGQEVIKAISGKGDPLKNFFFFDAMDGKGIIEDISKPDSGS